MAILQLVVCDTCGERDKPTTRYTVGDGKRRAKVDLCVDDATAFEAVLPSRVGRPPSSSTGRGPGRPRKPKAAAATE